MVNDRRKGQTSSGRQEGTPPRQPSSFFDQASLGWPLRSRGDCLAFGVSVRRRHGRGGSNAGVCCRVLFVVFVGNENRIRGIEKTIDHEYPQLGNQPADSFRTGGQAFQSIIDDFHQNADAYKTYDQVREILSSAAVTPPQLAQAEKKLQEARAVIADEPLFLIAEGEIAVPATTTNSPAPASRPRLTSTSASRPATVTGRRTSISALSPSRPRAPTKR